ncbi:MAG: ATP synthase F1 subunit gamma [Bacteroidia bacterium]|nr:ATP synthase F1 subunit gamma [Bacteroidia bacterium]MCX7652437.1 ATP synthase F1 subunit gamma [Bacteroidia bacterium]MDW8416838.1 ATP synthase F1 subunit gamma [Bacteroidia bacterium]
MSSGKLRELRGRIRSIISIQQTTRAMRMIAAVKLRKAQDRLLRLRPYRQQSEELLHTLLSQVEEPTKYQVTPPASSSLYVVLSSSRGLCGAFNSGLVRWLSARLPDPHQTELLILGKKAYEMLRRSSYKVHFQDVFGGKDIDHTTIRSIASQLTDRFLSGSVREVTLVYNRFGGVGKSIPTHERLFPLPVPDRVDVRPWILEPSLDTLLESFIPTYVETVLFSAVQESLTAEHSARMVAMQAATDNAEELLRTLRLQYNKARQASITKELLEIVAGAEALKG